MVAQTWAGGFEVTPIKTADYQATNAQVVPCDTSGGSFKITAPPTTLGISTSFGVAMFNQPNPIEIEAAEPIQPPRIDAPVQNDSFFAQFNGQLYFVFTGTDWILS